jgi:multiple sugar transport system permease protein
MSATAMPSRTVVASRSRRRFHWSRLGVHGFLAAMSALWLFPLAWAVYTSLRPYSDTQLNGYVSLPGVLNIDNFVDAWNQAELPHFYLNTLLVAVPSVILVLLIASMVAFGLTRFKVRFNLAMLMLFTAGNLLPPQVIIVPLFRLYLLLRGIPQPLSDNELLYDQYVGVILIHVVFQTGFCVFVLSNYMRTISTELTEAALVDGAGVATIYRRIILPLCRPALAALATLEFTFIYNDFFWALMLMKSGDRRPITSALNNLQGLFFSNNNLLAAGSLLVAIPTIVVFIALQKQFVRGLSLGSTKG